MIALLLSTLRSIKGWKKENSLGKADTSHPLDLRVKRPLSRISNTQASHRLHLPSRPQAGYTEYIYKTHGRPRSCAIDDYPVVISRRRD